MLDFLANNWVNILLVIVGLLAFVTYILQERRKVTEAASLIKMQIDELQNGIAQIDSFIVNGQLNSTAFYESQPLFKEDYWNKYKHYFISKIGTKDFSTFNKLFEYSAEIMAQQTLMKTMQNNSFYLTQQAIINVETTEIIKQINNDNTTKYLTDFKSKFIQQLPDDINKETVNKISDAFDKVISINIPTTNNLLANRQVIHNIINQEYLTPYCPIQIRLSLEKYIKKYTMLEIDGTEGYKTLKKISERKF